jgi:hypothetical protein
MSKSKIQRPGGSQCQRYPDLTPLEDRPSRPDTFFRKDSFYFDFNA